MKRKFKTCLNTKHLGNVLMMAIKGAFNDFDHILLVAIELC